jgi:chorismate mutase
MLEKYRKEIDDIDYQIIELLAKRFKIVKEI